MSASKFNTISKHISHSEEVYTDIRITGEDVIKKIKSLDNKTSDEILLILLNLAVQCTSNIINSLQEVVIKSNAEELSNANLKIVVKRLSQDCNDLVQGYHYDYSAIKSKFEAFLQNLLHEADGLFYVIKRDELHSHKHELVEALNEILCTILRVKVRIQIQNYSSEQLKATIKEMLKDFFEDLDNIKNTNDVEVLNNIAIHQRHASMHCFELAYYINKMASNYDGEIQHELLKAANALNVATTEVLLKPEKYKSIQEAIALLKEDCIKCWSSSEKLLDYIDNKVPNQKVANNLRDLVRHIVSFGITINNQKGKSIKRSSL